MVSTRELAHIRREIEEYRRRLCPGLTEANYRESQQAPAAALRDAAASRPEPLLETLAGPGAA